MDSKIGWVMRRQAADGAREGGDPAGEVFRGKLETLVREVLQNSKDAYLPKQRSVEVVFRFVDLSGQTLKTFLDALAWKELAPHIEALAKKQRRVAEALDGVKTEGRLRVLVIEDHNTVGLRGPEDGAEASGQPNEFAALTKDRLFSEKGESVAGGSYGLGKATLWAFSAFRTVVFNSKLSELLPSQESPRLFGRAQLAWHEVGKERYDGPGWFGRPGKHRERADSVMGSDAQERAKDLLIPRLEKTTGTSILIVAFDEPELEDRSLSQIGASVTEAVERWFWPSLQATRDRGLRVRVCGYENSRRLFDDEVTSTGPYKHYVQMITQYRAGELSPTLQNPGDVAMRPIRVKVPRKKNGAHAALEAEAHLVVSLANPDEKLAELNAVAAFRRPGMVVDYDDGPDKKLGLGKRPFYAVLVCGAAVDNDPKSEAFDAFLRMAENPAHDAWERWDRLREHYGTPYQQPLAKDLPSAIVKALRELVVVEGEAGEEAPAKLMQRFKVGGSKGPGEPKVALEKGAIALPRPDGTWEVTCAVTRGTTLDAEWSAIVDLRFATEDGASGDGRLFGTVESDTPGATVTLDDGLVVIRAKGVPPRKVKLRATTDPARYPHAAISAMTAVELRVREGGR